MRDPLPRTANDGWPPRVQLFTPEATYTSYRSTANARKRGSAKQYVYTYPSRAALLAVKSKVRALSLEVRNQTLTSLLDRLNPVLRD